MYEQLLNYFVITLLIGMVTWIVAGIGLFFDIDPLRIKPALHLHRYGFAVDPKHPFAESLNAALEGTFSTNDEVVD